MGRRREERTGGSAGSHGRRGRRATTRLGPGGRGRFGVAKRKKPGEHRKDPSGLPDFLRPFFWEVDFDSLRPDDWPDYIIERLLEYGDDRAIRWVRRTFGDEQVADVVRRSRRISRKTANFWAVILGIPRQEIRCLSEPSTPAQRKSSG